MAEELQQLDYSALPKRRRPLWMLLFWVALGAAPVSFLLPGIWWRGCDCGGTSTVCASNLRQIGQGIYLYAWDHDGRIPDFATVLATQQIDSGVFVCPETNDRTATGADLAATVRDFGRGGRCSYVFVHSWPTLDPHTSGGEGILAFEDPANHGFEGANVLYDDGHVDWIDERPLRRAESAEVAVDSIAGGRGEGVREQVAIQDADPEGQRPARARRPIDR